MVAALRDRQVKMQYTYGAWEQLLKAHLYIIQYSKNKLAQLLTPPLPAHYKGWICIHNGEGAWNSQTGNGFYGGLQMTYGWMGLVGNAALLSPLQQMWAAEKGLQENWNNRFAWLSGQWPHTYPPCSGYF